MRSTKVLCTVNRVSGDERAPVAFSERRWVVTVMLALFAVVAMVAVTLGPYPHAKWTLLVLAVVACTPILLLEGWPVSLFAIAVAATGLLDGSGVAVLPLGVVLGVGTYFMASRTPRRRSLPISLAGAVVIAVSLLASHGFPPRDKHVLGEQLTYSYLPIVAGWFVGDAVSARRRYHAGLADQRERELASEAERAQQEVHAERVRIARELHDVVAHTLAVITVQAGVARRLMDKRPDEVRTTLESIETIGRTAQDELRVVLGLLRDESLEHAPRAPAPGLVDLKELVETVQAAGTPVTLQVPHSDARISPALELTLYRIVQEALTNVVKHAPGAATIVDLTISSDGVCVEIVDTGDPRLTGPPPAASSSEGHGIAGMRERVMAFGGTLVAEPRGNGFHVEARIPMEGGAG